MIFKKLIFFFLILFTVVYAADLILRLPYESGESFVITQGYNTLPTHIKKDSYALDLTQDNCNAYGKPVLSVADGIVIDIKIDSGDKRGYGNVVKIDHGNNIESIYAHLKNFNVVKNQKVQQGEIMGSIGNTGDARGEACEQYPGTHLHFAMYQKQGDGSLVAYRPEPISGYTNLLAGMTLKSDNILVQKEKPKGLFSFSFFANAIDVFANIFNPPPPAEPLLATTPPQLPQITQEPTSDAGSAQEPELQQENQDVRHSVANNQEINTSADAEQNVPQPKFIEPLTSNNSGLPYPGFGGGAPPPTAPPAPPVTESVIVVDEKTPELPPLPPPPSDTTLPDVSLSIFECQNSLTADYCLLTTNILNISWSSSADDFDYFEFNNNGSISTTTATLTVTVVADNSTNNFSVRAKDKTGNWSEPQTTTVVVCSMPVVINEIAWSGTPDYPYDEWIELYNRTNQSITLDNWVLQSEDKKLYIPLSGKVSPKGYYLLERKDDYTVSDIFADLIYGNDGPDWALNNSGETLILSFASTTIDQTPAGGWAGGNEQGWSMERYDPDAAGTARDNWGYNNSVIVSGKNIDGYNINGTARARNSVNYLIAKGASSIFSDITLTKENSPYLVTNNFQTFQNGAVLTIEPGVVIKFHGWGMNFYDNAQIIAQGRADEPVVFTSFNDDEKPEWDIDGIISTSTPGSWYGVELKTKNQDSVFDNVIFRYGGGYTYGTGSRANLYLENASANITNSVFEYSKVHGLYLINSSSTVSSSIFRNNGVMADYAAGIQINIGGGPKIQNNIISRNRQGLCVSDSLAIIDSNIFESNEKEAICSNGLLSVFTNNSGANNSINTILVAGNLTQENATTTLKANPLPYYIAGYGTPAIVASSTLVIEPGVVIKGSDPREPLFEVYGNLIIAGTNPDDIVFTSFYDDGGSIVPNKGQWSGIVMKPGSFSDIKGATFKYADTAITYQNSPINLDNVKFLENNLDFLEL